MTYFVQVVALLGNNGLADEFSSEADARLAAVAYRQKYPDSSHDVILSFPDGSSEYFDPA